MEPLAVASGIVMVRVFSPPAGIEVALPSTAAVKPLAPLTSTEIGVASVPGLLSVNTFVVPAVARPKL